MFIAMRPILDRAGLAALAVAMLRGCGALADDLDPMAQPPPASAARPPPDKSRYWLLDPTPPDLMRKFNTARPTKPNTPYTVDAGHFLYESDIFNWTYDHWNVSGTTANTYLFTSPVLKLGLTNSTDLQVGFTPRERVRNKDRATGRVSDASGFGDVLTRVSTNLWGNDGGDSAMALIPFLKWPTAEPGLGGNDQLEGGVSAPIVFRLPFKLALLFNIEVDVLKNSSGNGRHANVISAVNVSRPILDNLTLYAELWSDVNDDRPNTTRQLTFDTALAWLVRPNLQLDIGANLGLDKRAPDVQVYFGIAQRF
jgi:hypothetical protein